ncbi:uncharacterized protein BP5553_03302 [Venustampulla echinocandica]|uniref:Uncharacterized protein n=1 Tax=Venustampulla echinocandica TaxID=2656787 RepID=A0A370TTV3_9HELO|nr:uncharacterized protein BP5553_03302 [Venustampulla echinocandica]RDL38962.1 hypothetical protein BP5553_03302 [Venustampulla echinocandica]
MATSPPMDLDNPFQRDKLLQLRTSKMQKMHNLSILTGIYKQPRASRVFCSFTGLESDEHDLTFHGGLDKAVHQYYPGHYPLWRSELPDSNGSFDIGGFGENLVSDNMNERNVCIGDVISIGDVVLQVSLPRQPCFKLNHRFGLKGFAPQTWKKSRTGWYYRVLKEGWMGVGDDIILVERKHPSWTIERVQEYLHRDKQNMPMLEQLVQIDEFGNECKKAFRRLLAAAKAQHEGATKVPEVWQEFVVIEKKRQTPRIVSFLLEAAVKGSSPGNDLDPGSFVRVKLPNGLIRSYSIVNGTTHRIQLGVALAATGSSRGGSEYMHSSLQEGATILCGKVTKSVPIREQASNHIFIAGGIGITAFLAQTAIYTKINFNYVLHYAVRSASDIPFRPLIEEMGSKVVVYDQSQGQRMDISAILQNRIWNSYIYVCGPPRMIDAVQRAAAAHNIGDDEIHYEAFQAERGGDPFTVQVRGHEDKIMDVGPDESLLEVLRREGWSVESSCEVGNCGTCQVSVCEGTVEHRGVPLCEHREGNKAMLSCVSRGLGHLVVGF